MLTVSASVCAGSSFKPITGVIGLSTGAPGSFGTDESGTDSGGDASWGKYQVTTLHDCSRSTWKMPIYSDNIYFAKAAEDRV